MDKEALTLVEGAVLAQDAGTGELYVIQAGYADSQSDARGVAIYPPQVMLLLCNEFAVLHIDTVGFQALLIATSGDVVEEAVLALQEDDLHGSADIDTRELTCLDGLLYHLAQFLAVYIVVVICTNRMAHLDACREGYQGNSHYQKSI